MGGPLLALLGLFAAALNGSAGTIAPTTILVGNPVGASVVAGQPSCEGTDQIQYRVTFAVVRVEKGKAPAKRPTAIVCSHQKAGIFDAAAYLLVGNEQSGFDAYKAHLIACSGDPRLADMSHYKLQASGAASSPSEGSDCVLL